jgi:hypothetical protein
MRVIRTEEYFHPSKVEWNYEELMHGNPGVGIAFIKLPKPAPTNLNDFDRFEVNITPMGDPARADVIIDQFLNVAIQGADSRSARNLMVGYNPPEQPLIQQVRNLDIILETSPPFLMNFNVLLKSAGPAVAIGTFVGISAATYPILLITVPAGIVAVGAAIAISKIMQDGFPKVVERWISRPASESPPPLRAA